MGFKRTSKKTGANTRRTQTINNKNSSVTTSNSAGGKYNRMTYSNNSKTGNRTMRTWRDGAGFTHRQTVYSTAGADRERERQRKRNAKLWASLFGTNKKKTSSTTKSAKRVDSSSAKQPSPTQAQGSPVLGWMIIGVICWGLYQLFY